MDNEKKVLIQHESTHETITLDPVEFSEEAFEQGKIYSCENFGYTADFQDDRHICPEQPPLIKLCQKRHLCWWWGQRWLVQKCKLTKLMIWCQKFKCSGCQESFEVYSQLEIHFADMHTEQLLDPEKICIGENEFTAAHLSAWNTTKSTKVEKVKEPVQCDICKNFLKDKKYFITA